VVAVVVAGAAAVMWAGGESETGDETANRAGAGGDPEAETTLEAVQAATAEASSFRFRFQGVDTTMAYWDGGARRFTGEGAWSTERWRLVTRDQDDASETIIDGESVHSRWLVPGGDLEHEPWERWESWEDDPPPRDELLAEMSGMLSGLEAEDGDLDDEFVDQLAVALLAGLYLDGTVTGSIGRTSRSRSHIFPTARPPSSGPSNAAAAPHACSAGRAGRRRSASLWAPPTMSPPLSAGPSLTDS
jgi:hypothetical protein